MKYFLTVPEKRQCVVNFESQNESFDKICCLLNVGNVFCLLPSADLHVPIFDVETDLELQVFNNGRENFHPVVFQWSEPDDCNTKI